MSLKGDAIFSLSKCRKVPLTDEIDPARGQTADTWLRFEIDRGDIFFAREKNLGVETASGLVVFRPCPPHGGIRVTAGVRAWVTIRIRCG